jgi:hypothetical protein
MPSPFPGMNPYVESPDLWEDFHQNLAVQIRYQLVPYLRPKYYAALVSCLTYEKIVPQEKLVTAQSKMVECHKLGLAGLTLGTVTVPPPPLVESIAYEVPVKLWTIEIRQVGLDTLITSIKLLAPVNKRAKHEAYVAHQRKRTSLMRAGVNLLEIDLLRTGRRWSLPDKKLPDAPYFVFLWRVLSPKRLGIWPLKLREPIPVLPVPLREPDPDIPLDLTQAIHNIYDRAGYDMRIDYTKPPPKPDFSEEDAAWIKTITATVL